MPGPAWVAPVRSRTSGASNRSATIHFFSGPLSNRSRPPDHLSKELHRTRTSPARRKGAKKYAFVVGWDPEALPRPAWVAPVRSRTSGAAKKKCHHPLFFLDHFLTDRRPPEHRSTGLYRTRTSSARRKGVKNMRTCGWRGPRGLAEAGVGRPSQVTNFGCIEKKCHHPLFFLDRFLTDRVGHPSQVTNFGCIEKKVPPSPFFSGPLSNRSWPQTTSVRACTGQERPRHGVRV